MIVDEERAHRVSGSEEPFDGEPPLDHEDGVFVVEPDTAGRVVEAPVEPESRIVRIVYPDQWARSDDRAVQRDVRHLFSFAYLAPG